MSKVEQIQENVLFHISQIAECEVETISLDDDLKDDLELESLPALEILVNIEGDYSIKIHDTEVDSLNTPRDIINIVLQKTKVIN